MADSRTFNPKCHRCPRLASFLETVREQYPDYHGRPVPAFGDPDPRLLVVGLAPGLHGANATGRPFTGDFAGLLLYKTLYEYGFSNRAASRSAKDGLALKGCRITNAVKCVPPQNAPQTGEIRHCNDYLRHELAALRPGTVILALGTIAHQSVLMALGLKRSAYPFKHGAEHTVTDGLHVIDSYHTSRYNIQTRRLSEAMFHAVFDRIQARLA
ncbi:MAG TPA: uracil-DNA glycosylase, partial [Gammaproteobacteria bacterium]|nr:uracil-DNA glycosylase [Gammaproteobacteria bacterium]